MGRFAKPNKGFVLLLLWFMSAVAAAEYMAYKDPKQPLGARIRDLMNRMTLEEKIGQMTQIERKVASSYVMKQYFIGKPLCIINCILKIPVFGDGSIILSFS